MHNLNIIILDKFTGLCLSVTECDDSFYGINCLEKCGQCRDTSPVCNKATGSCSDGCKPGYKPLTCKDGMLNYVYTKKNSKLKIIYSDVFIHNFKNYHLLS